MAMATSCICCLAFLRKFGSTTPAAADSAPTQIAPCGIRPDSKRRTCCKQMARSPYVTPRPSSAVASLEGHMTIPGMRGGRSYRRKASARCRLCAASLPLQKSRGRSIDWAASVVGQAIPSLGDDHVYNNVFPLGPVADAHHRVCLAKQRSLMSLRKPDLVRIYETTTTTLQG